MLYGKLTKVQEGQALTGNLDFFAVTVGADITITANRDTETQKYYSQARVWEMICEVLSMRTQPVIMSALDADGFSFATEKTTALDAAEIQAKIRELGTVKFGNSTADLSGVVVEKVEFKLH